MGDMGKANITLILLEITSLLVGFDSDVNNIKIS
jgi:hypothetical protein